MGAQMSAICLERLDHAKGKASNPLPGCQGGSVRPQFRLWVEGQRPPQTVPALDAPPVPAVALVYEEVAVEEQAIGHGCRMDKVLVGMDLAAEPLYAGPAMGRVGLEVLENSFLVQVRAQTCHDVAK